MVLRETVAAEQDRTRQEHAVRLDSAILRQRRTIFCQVVRSIQTRPRQRQHVDGLEYASLLLSPEMSETLESLSASLRCDGSADFVLTKQADKHNSTLVSAKKVAARETNIVEGVRNVFATQRAELEYRMTIWGQGLQKGKRMTKGSDLYI